MDTFRLTYRQLTPSEKEMLHNMKLKAQELLEEYNRISQDLGPSRELALAVTNLEQSVMWATKAIT